MRIFALELNNEIKGIVRRKEYIESHFQNQPDSMFQRKTYVYTPLFIKL